ncbi:MAG: hypothetical protein KJO95_09295 [Gammaproteobacteria bacterium]|nr:hypothetical protein [Gammaproteobacteria bacterium]MBU2677708.1 hypothetical protein [Gammaproteobacteria bacterium]NNL51441.1 hypothetical protein [Woeseiaceae bacterium]
MNENGNNKAKPRSGHLGFMSPFPKSIIRESPLRDYLKAANPDLKSDIDQFSDQLEHLSKSVLTEIVEGDDTICEQLDIKTGRLNGSQQRGLASEEREKRKVVRANSQRFWVLIGVVIATALVSAMLGLEI